MTTTLLFLALFFDLYLPPYLLYIDVLQSPREVRISKNEAWNRIHKKETLHAQSQWIANRSKPGTRRTPRTRPAQ